MRNFYVIAGGYLLFTLTDSAIRMIVLFELYKRSFQVRLIIYRWQLNSPSRVSDSHNLQKALNIAIMFTLYELAGVFTNLLGGIAGSKWGLRFCLLLGLLFQLVGIGMLMGLQDSWVGTPSVFRKSRFELCRKVSKLKPALFLRLKEKYTIIIYITCAQAFSGVAKDLVKMVRMWVSDRHARN